MLMVKKQATPKKSAAPAAAKQTASKKKTAPVKSESDSAFLLKLVLYIIFGSLWLKFAIPIQLGSFSISAFPIGLVLGLIFASHDTFQIDRKIEYTILIIMTVLTFFVPAAILINP